MHFYAAAPTLAYAVSKRSIFWNIVFKFFLPPLCRQMPLELVQRANTCERAYFKHAVSESRVLEDTAATTAAASGHEDPAAGNRESDTKYASNFYVSYNAR